MSTRRTTYASPHGASVAWRIAIGYALVLFVVIGLMWLVLAYGNAHVSTADEVNRPSARITVDQYSQLYHVLLALVSILLLGRWIGKLFVHFGQPRVIGEIVAGIMLGPSLLGQVWPAAKDFILPADVAPYLGIISQIGIILYMFLVGLELNAGLLRSRAHATVAISHMSILLPFLLGAILALWLFPHLAPEYTPFTSFALFMGIAMSITAFPVLARILTDRRMEDSELGVVALSCAAVDDVTAWCLLAFVVGIAQSQMGGALQTIIYAVVYIAMMLTIVRPLAMRYLGPEADHPPRRMTVWVLVALLFSAMTAEWIGIHAIFGAFLLGAVIPHDAEVARDFQHKLEDIVVILLLPAFFAYTGMRTEIQLVSGWQAWMFCAVIILVATLGKFGGSYAAARFTGLDRRLSAALGVLMNTRGLMELIVLNIGLELHVISPELFAMMVIMALVTTIATTPVLHALTVKTGGLPN
ncbi:MAG TPA: cation:proton antiporter [Lacipirellulaceae bacterium]|nr:cation:proton antiporter [Lacipirellulaceae bacterium]